MDQFLLPMRSTQSGGLSVPDWTCLKLLKTHSKRIHLMGYTDNKSEDLQPRGRETTTTIAIEVKLAVAASRDGDGELK